MGYYYKLKSDGSIARSVFDNGNISDTIKETYLYTDREIVTIYNGSLKFKDETTPADFEPPTYIPTEKEIQEAFEREIEDWMNSVVAERDYDNIDTCIARYTDSPNPKYSAEAKAVKIWNTMVWDKCWDILAQVKTGERTIPTLEEVITELPKLVW